MKKILVLDDLKHIRHVYQRLIRDAGFKVSTAATAIEANEIIKNEPVDILLLDINMPHVNGREFFEIARRFHPNIKIMITSVYPYEDQKTLIPEADDYFDKADSLDVLKVKIFMLAGFKQK